MKRSSNTSCQPAGTTNMQHPINMNLALIDTSGSTSFHEILMRFAVNTIAISIIICAFFLKRNKNEDFVLPLYLIGIVIFLTCSYLGMVKVELGIALGLFAIFSILRFRTSNVSAYNMAYLLVVIGTSAVNALADFPNLSRGMLLSNGIILVSITCLEIYQRKRVPEKQSMVFENLELLKPSKREQLIDELTQRTEFPVHHVEIETINYKKEEAKIIIYYNNH